MSPTIVSPAPAAEIQSLLRKLGAPGCYKGFDQVVYAVQRLLESPRRIHEIVRVYWEAADALQVGRDTVERDIRTIVKAVWNNPDHTLLDRVAGRTLCRRPKVSEFLDMLAYYLSSTS